MQNPTCNKPIATERDTDRQKEIKESRRELLDLLEVALAGSPSWPLVRAKVMDIFGRKGLQGGGQ